VITIRKGSQRGRTKISWLDSKHTFSFGDYYDAAHMGHRTLRVINDDVVAPGQGFATHSHRDMEILSYVVHGQLEHRDSLGNGSTIRPGEVQRMTAGTGITHSEYNPSRADPVRFLQMWLLPIRNGLEPSYEQRAFALPERHNRLRLVASRDGRDESVTVHQNSDLYLAALEPGVCVEHGLARGHSAWLQVVRGNVTASGAALGEGDGAAILSLDRVEIVACDASEILLFDLA
jgi:redox-sensitive bicupin YhaK (pirin superfamily)